MSKVVYKTKATAEGGREGRISTDDGILDLKVSVPKSMGGPGKEQTNPEQLFAAGYAACFDSALNFIASQEKEEITSRVEVTVGLKATTATELDLMVELSAQIDGVNREKAEELLQKAHTVCPYSKAINGNVDVTLTLK